MPSTILEKHKPFEDGKLKSNIEFSVVLQLIRAAFCWMTSGKSTSNITSRSREPSACKRKYSESNPAPNDRIYKKKIKEVKLIHVKYKCRERKKTQLSEKGLQKKVEIFSKT